MGRLLGEMLTHNAPVYRRGHLRSEGGLWLTVAGLATPLTEEDGGSSPTGAVIVFSGFRDAYDRKGAEAPPAVQPVQPTV